MKRFIYFTLTFAILLLWSSCRKDFEFIPSNGNLGFSKDTVYLDTVFANIGSSTYNLKVYNNSSEDISIPNVSLENGINSGYRLNVDGQAGKSFTNVEILAKDSLFIFVETTFDENQTPLPANEFLYTDRILFDSGTLQQDVDLVTLVKDAVLIFPDRDSNNIVETLSINLNGEIINTAIQGRELEASELTFTNQKPYVIYGYAAVPNGQTLTIDAGARVHFHENSGILVNENATLNVNGSFSPDQETLDNEVVFESDRLEPIYENVPGQWGTIWLSENSINNTINYATIKNATIGVLSDENPNPTTDKLTITNTQIYNSSTFGVLGRRTSITANNLVINNSGQASFAATFGGKYNVTHSTIANYWSNSFRQFPALLINNFRETADAIEITDLTEANFSNCIIYGNDDTEFLLDELEDPAVVFNFKFTNCLTRFPVNNPNFSGNNYMYSDNTKYDGVIFNQDPLFLDSSNNQLIINSTSPAVNQGNTTIASQVPNDILNNDRTTSPDLGAYQNDAF
jgi:hypothetical protein